MSNRPKGGSAFDFGTSPHGLSADLHQTEQETLDIIGARKHPLTKKWWIYPPAKLVTGRLL